jgi:peptide/nickel transport system substrate-binding protein
MKETKKKNNGISRRDFLKKTGAGAGALALGGIFSPRRASAKLVGNVPASKFIYSWEESLMNIDPQVAAHVPPYSYRLNMYGELYRYQGSPPKLEPWIAESYEASLMLKSGPFVSKKGLNFTMGMRLRLRMCDSAANRCWRWKGRGCQFQAGHEERCSEGYRQIHLSIQSGQTGWVFSHADSSAGIVNSKLVKQNEKSGDYGAAWLANNEAGRAYKLKTWDPAKGFVANSGPDGRRLVRNISKKSRLNTIVEMSSRVAALMKGDIHATDPSTPDQIDRLNKNPNTKVITTETMDLLIRLNCIRPPPTICI